MSDPSDPTIDTLQMEQERLAEAKEYERLSEAAREYTKLVEPEINRPVKQIKVDRLSPTKRPVKQKIMTLPTHLVFKNFKK